MKVPFLDLRAQYESMKDEVETTLRNVLLSCAFAGGPFVKQFEQSFAKFCNCRHAIGVASGTHALWMSLAVLGIRAGDEVITAPNSFIATAEAISMCGALPVFADIIERTYTIDPCEVEKAITPRTKAIIPVHLFGQIADMDPILEIAHKHNLFVIEDACQAHGAEYKGRRAGTIGDLGCFSFYPGKNLGAYGEAGAVITNDTGLAEKLAIFRDHGQLQKYYHQTIGWNARMDGFQGAILELKLKYLADWTNARRQNADRYNQLLVDVDNLILPCEDAACKHVYHIYAIRLKNRDDTMKQLAEKSIYCGIHYPVPIHLQEAYCQLNYTANSFPVVEMCSRELLSLPMYPELTAAQIEFVARHLKQLLGS